MNMDIGTLCFLNFNEYGLSGLNFSKQVQMLMDWACFFWNILKVNEERSLLKHHAVHEAPMAETEPNNCHERWGFKEFPCSHRGLYFHWPMNQLIGFCSRRIWSTILRRLIISGCRTDWLNDWLIDWLIDQPTDQWLTGCLTAWLTDCLAHWLT